MARRLVYSTYSNKDVDRLSKLLATCSLGLRKLDYRSTLAHIMRLSSRGKAPQNKLSMAL